MIEIMLSIILLPFAVIGVVFTGALGVSFAKAAYKKLLKV